MTTGVDGRFLLAIAQRESSLNTVARNRRSSARGLMQFTDATWLETVRDFGHRHGRERQAEALRAAYRNGGEPSGRLRAEVLRLRHDPGLAAAMAAERLERWRALLRPALGREPTETDLYLVHLLGPVGAQRFLGELARAPRQAATSVVGNAARANPTLFTRGGRSLTLAEVYAETTRSISGVPPEVAELRAEGPAAPVQLAAR
jgi:hypothetical protein